MIDYDETRIFPLIFQLKGSVWLRSVKYALPTAVATFLITYLEFTVPMVRRWMELEVLMNSQIWNATTACLVFLIGFRTNRAYSRFWEGTGLLHQMKGEWFDTCSNIVTFTVCAKEAKKEDVQKFRGTIVRLMSLTHASALEEISCSESQLPTIDVFGIEHNTLKHLKECVEVHRFNKVEALLHVMQTSITKAHMSGLLDIPPPILSRVYQTLSRGYVNLLNTKKITDTKFPFPYVQIISLMLLLHMILTPLIFASTLRSLIWGPIISFLPIFGIFAMNFVAMELENPFGIDPNDLPLADFQKEMNSCLMMLLHPNADLVATLGPQAMGDFSCILEDITKEEVSCINRFNTNMLACSPQVSPTAGAAAALKRSFSRDHFRLRGFDKSEGLQASVHENKHDGSSDGTASLELDGGLGKQSGASVQQEAKCGKNLESASSMLAEARQPSGRPDDLQAGLGAKVAVAEAKLDRRSDTEVLLANMDELSRSLQIWTQAMEEQFKELRRSLDAMRGVLHNTGPAGRFAYRDSESKATSCEASFLIAEESKTVKPLVLMAQPPQAHSPSGDGGRLLGKPAAHAGQLRHFQAGSSPYRSLHSNSLEAPSSSI